MGSIIGQIISSFGIYGLILASIYFIVKLYPVTLMTSHESERKLYSKEANFIFKMINYCGFLLSFSLLAYIVTLLVWWLRIKYYDIAFQIILLITMIIYAGIYLIKYSKTDIKKANKILSPKVLDVIIYCYFIWWVLIIGYFFGAKTINTIVVNGQLNIFKHIAIFIAIFICVILFSELLLPPIIYLARLGATKKEFIINLDEKPWYLFHPINKDEYLIGDKACLDDCEEIRVIKREEIINRDILLKG